MKNMAISKTGRMVEKNGKKEFKFGFFSHSLINCNKCNHNCKKGIVNFEGFSNTDRKSFQICKEMKHEKEMVKVLH